MAKVKFTAHNLRRLIMFIMKALIIIVPSLMFYYTLHKYIPMPYYNRGFWLVLLFYAILLIIVSNPYDMLLIGILRKRNLQISYIIAITLTNFVTYMVLCLISRKIINPSNMIFLTLAQYLIGFIMYEIAAFVYKQLYPSRDTVIIYADSAYDKDVARKFEVRKDRYTIKSVVKETEGVEKIKAEIDKYSTVIIGAIDLYLRNEIIDYCYSHGKRIFVLPSINDIVLRSAHITQINDSIMHLVKDRTLSLEQLMIKRAFDIAFSLFVLLVSSPILLIVALCIKLYDGGPIFFKQKRLTRNKETFEIIKFRSMIVDAEKNGAQFTTNHDDRITPIGKFIRATRIDEIPQFINVLRGDMSVVGPRAERVENYDLYSKLMPEFYYRTKVKAGITGYAQIYGRYNTSHEDKARMDVYYIETYSFWNDLQLILSTLKVIFTPEATEGFSSSFFEGEEKLEDVVQNVQNSTSPENNDDLDDKEQIEENVQQK